MPELLAKQEEVNAAISANTATLGADAYIAKMNEQLTEISNNIAQVDSGLIELNKGKLTASIEFSDKKAQMMLGESQMTSAESQLESAESELEAGKEQLADALSQIEDGEKQLADAREDAYDSADMAGILTVDTVKSLLTAQNFSMPAGYVNEEGMDYMVRIGDKPEDIEDLKKLPLLNLHMDGVDIITLVYTSDELSV